MRRVSAIAFLFLTTLCIMQAVPARKCKAVYSQPDGRNFEVSISGDEWNRRVTTADGAYIIRDSERWWCYALFDASGRRYSSGVRVGDPVPARILALSRRFPSEKVSRKAALRRAELRAAVTRSPRPPRLSSTRSPDGPATPAEHRILVILAQTQDMSFSNGRDRFLSMLTQTGYSYNGATGCAQEYFNHQLEGVYDVHIDVSEIVTVSENMAFYGANNADGEDTAPEKLVGEACQLAHDSPVNPIDFSRYDADGDGSVDNIFVFVPGGDEADGAGDDCIWSHSWSLRAGGINLTLDGKTVDTYAISTELTRIYSGRTSRDVFTGIGTFCHEYSHILGLPDYYDTDYEDSGGRAEAMWDCTALMDSGNQNNDFNTPPNYNAVSLDELGLGTCEAATFGTYTLQPISREKRYLKLETDHQGEYYLLECRDNSGWDAYIRGKGLAIYHIDKSPRAAGLSTSWDRIITAYNRWYDYNEINCRPDRQCADFVEASPSAMSARSIFFPSGRVNKIGPDTTPAITWWSGRRPEVIISDITLNADGSVSFRIGGELTVTGTSIFQDAVIMSWEGTTKPCTVSVDCTPRDAPIQPGSNGKAACVIDGLTPNTEYTITVSDGSASATRTLKTKPYYNSGIPFIYLNDLPKNEDGTFPAGTKLPLRVYNAPYAVSVEWTFAGRPIEPGADGYFTVSRSEKLQALVTYADGTTDIITKELSVK